jgi:hypothetical protein
MKFHQLRKYNTVLAEKTNKEPQSHLSVHLSHMCEDNQTLLKRGKKSGHWNLEVQGLSEAIRDKVNMSSKSFPKEEKRVTFDLWRAMSGTRSTCLENQTFLNEGKQDSHQTLVGQSASQGLQGPGKHV